MAHQRDDFTKPVVEALAKRAAYVCSNPDCRVVTLSPSYANKSKYLYIGKAAHISAAATGGARYDASMTAEQRMSAENGIFLCSNCADMIDKNQGIDFSIDRLRRWKIDHDEFVKRLANGTAAVPPLTPSTTITLAFIGQQNYELAKRLLTGVLEVHDLIRGLRQEVSLDNKSQLWERLEKQLSELDAAFREARAMWGDILADRKRRLKDCVAQFRHSTRWLGIAQKDCDRLPESSYESIVAQHDPVVYAQDDDVFGKQLANAAAGLEIALRPFLEQK